MKCELILSEVPLHLYQIIGGFVMLKKDRELDLKITKLQPDSEQRLPYNMLEAVVDDKRLIFDMNDGYCNLLTDDMSFADFYNPLLDRCDFLFKRSFRREMNEQLKSPEKIKTVGLNFFVTVKGSPAHYPVPCDPDKEKIKKLIRLFPSTEYFNGHYNEHAFRASPVINSKPKILFMARLWDPNGDYEGQLTKQMSEERHIINEHRAACIRLCRKEFGTQFFGGISYSKFAKEAYPDIILENPGISKKDSYLRHMKSFDIHISTIGLHNSTGWKFAEYIAASKSIVSEPLYYESFSGLADGHNYLSFSNEYDCINKIYELKNDAKRYEMMCNNKEYYSNNMTCKLIIKNALDRI